MDFITLFSPGFHLFVTTFLQFLHLRLALIFHQFGHLGIGIGNDILHLDLRILIYGLYAVLQHVVALVVHIGHRQQDIVHFLYLLLTVFIDIIDIHGLHLLFELWMRPEDGLG